MSDPVIKGAKRPATRPASQSVSSKSSAKSRKLTAKSARPQPKPKRTAVEKAPVRKATPIKKSKATPAKASTAKTFVKASRSTAKPTKPTPAKKKAKVASSPPKKVAAKPRPSVANKATAAPKPQSVGKVTPAPKATARHGKAVPAAKPTQKPAPPPPRKPTVDEAAALKAFERAHKEFTRGRFSDARGLFRALIEQHSGVVEVTARARTYLTIAEARLRTEATLPRDAESLYDRGVIELNRGEYVAAQEMFERAIKREPESADSHYALAATRARLGSVEFALQSLERALELRPALRVRAQHDPDLTLLRNEPEFERIVYAASRS